MNDVDDRDSFKIGELSARTGVARHTIRFYERKGVLPEPERTPSGYRTYGPAAVERLEFIGKGQALGLRLDDIKQVLRETLTRFDESEVSASECRCTVIEGLPSG